MPSCPPLAPVLSAVAFPGVSTDGYENYQKNSIGSCVPLLFDKHPISQLCRLALTYCEKEKPVNSEEFFTISAGDSQSDTAKLYEELPGNAIAELEVLLGIIGEVKNKTTNTIDKLTNKIIKALEELLTGNMPCDKVYKFVKANCSAMLLTNAQGKTGVELLLEHHYNAPAALVFEYLVAATAEAKRSLNNTVECPRDLALHMYSLMLTMEEMIGFTDLSAVKYCINREKILQYAPYADVRVTINKHTLLYHAIQLKDIAFAALLLANDASLLNIRDEYSQQFPLEMDTTPAVKGLLNIAASTLKKN